MQQSQQINITERQEKIRPACGPARERNRLTNIDGRTTEAFQCKSFNQAHLRETIMFSLNSLLRHHSDMPCAHCGGNFAFTLMRSEQSHNKHFVPDANAHIGRLRCYEISIDKASRWKRRERNARESEWKNSSVNCLVSRMRPPIINIRRTKNSARIVGSIYSNRKLLLLREALAHMVCRDQIENLPNLGRPLSLIMNPVPIGENASGLSGGHLCPM